MLSSGLTVEPRNLVCTKWFSDNTFLWQGLKIDQDFSSPCFIPSYIQSFRYPHDRIHFLCDIYISALLFFFLSIFFFFCLLYPFFPFSYPFFALISYLTNSFSIPQIDKWKKKPTRGHTTPKRNMLLTNQILFALRLHFCWYLTIKTKGEQRFRCVSEWVYSSQNTVWATGTPVMAVEKNGTKSTIWTVQKRNNKRTKPALNDKCCLFCGFISLSNPNPEENPTVRFFCFTHYPTLSTFSYFQVSPKYFLDGIFGNCLDFPFRLKLLSGIKVEMLNLDLGLLYKKCWQKTVLCTWTWFKFE